MKFNEKLIQLRKQRGFTQEELAEQMGVSRQAISRWEAGETTPEMAMLRKLCDIFQISADYLINDDIQTEADIPVVKKKEAEVAGELKVNRKLILFSACCMTIAAIAWFLSIGLSPNDSSALLGLKCFCLAFSSAVAVIQFVNYFIRKKP